MLKICRHHLVTLATALVVFSVNAAEQRIVLDFADTIVQGENTLMLKKEIQAQHPALKLNRYSLEKVRLVAKSKMGKGQAKLQVGSESTFIYDVDGSPESFASSNPASFFTIDFNRPGYDSQGVWQIHLKGNIKIKRVVLLLSESSSTPWPDQNDDDWGSDHGALSFNSIDSLYVDRFETTERISIRERGVKAIRLSSERGTIRVVEAVVSFADGGKVNLFELEGTLFEGDEKVMRFTSVRDVLGITLTTISRTGSRLGKLDVAIATKR